MLDTNLGRVIDAVAKEKGIEKEIVIEALKEAMLAAAKKKLGISSREARPAAEGEEITEPPERTRVLEAQFNEESGEIEVFEFKDVAETVDNPELQISLSEARELDPEAQPGDSMGIKLDTSELGRIPAQAARQILLQKVRDAERELIFSEYKDRKSEVVSGVVRRFEKGNIIVDLGRTEAVLEHKQQVPRETYRPGDRIRAYILDVNKNNRGPIVELSRSSPEFVRRLFENEVPEIAEGAVEVVAIAREPGARTKIAVRSRDSDVDPVGACVGMKGSRVQAVVQELRGEKIDIVVYDDEVHRFAINSLAPAEVLKVIARPESQTLQILVADDQLSLAIGKRGQNVRLASMLLGWKIDIKSEAEFAKLQAAAKAELRTIEGITDMQCELLYSVGYRTVDEVADTPIDELASIEGFDEEIAKRIWEGATKSADLKAEGKLVLDLDDKQSDAEAAPDGNETPAGQPTTTEGGAA
ncbi:MAG: transcription termination/antitermination protein NusA [Deltaproteobacteria bacterium]|nr:transcription termination/antitermination protein NusA [Deltaproteobacteria bacterium]